MMGAQLSFLGTMVCKFFIWIQNKPQYQ